MTIVITTNERVKTREIGGYNVKYVIRMDTMTNKMYSMVIKKANNSANVINFYIQIGQLAKTLHTRTQGMLLSNTKVNPKEEGIEKCKAIVTRSGVAVESEDEKKNEKKDKNK